MIAITGAAGFIGSNLAHRLGRMERHLLLVDHTLTAAKAVSWVGLSRFCFVSDERFLDALRYRNLPVEDVSGIFNSGTGTVRTFEDLARAVFAALGRGPRIRFNDMPPELSRQYQNFTRADMTKLREAGYTQTAATLEDGMRQAIAAEVRHFEQGD